MFIVKGLIEELKINVTGCDDPLMVSLKLKDGMLGVIPVFEDRERADRSAAGNFQVLEMTEWKAP